MLVFQYIIFNIFTFLVFLSPQDSIDNSEVSDDIVQVISSSGDHQNTPDVVELGLQLHQIFDTSQTPELQFSKQFHKTQQPNARRYTCKLLYFDIGKSIELHLTSTTIIFPFHCFT